MNQREDEKQSRATLQDVLSAWIFFVVLLGCFALGAQAIELAVEALKSNVISAETGDPGLAGDMARYATRLIAGLFA